MKVFPGLKPLGRTQFITLRFYVYDKDGKLHNQLFAEALPDPEGGPVKYYLNEILDDDNNTSDGFLSDEAPPEMTKYELAIRDILALEAAGG